jgi:hypothetical protein
MLSGFTSSIDSVALAELPTLSVTVNVNEGSPTAVGVPEIVPPLESISPAGSPEPPLQVRLPVPPVAASGVEYGVFMTTPGNADVVILRPVLLKITVTACDPLSRPLESVAVTVKLTVPGLLGVVPKSIPVLEGGSQEGSPVSLHVYVPEPPDAARVTLKELLLVVVV